MSFAHNAHKLRNRVRIKVMAGGRFAPLARQASVR